MDEIGQNIANQIINESAKIISLYPGSFSPPHRGHFTVVERAAPHVDEVHVIISNNIREGYTPEVSLKVWKQYQKLLPENVKVYIAKANSPITEIYDIVKDKTNNYLVIYGKGEQDRFNSINENRDKYSNVDVVDAGNFDNLSATALREAIGSKNRLLIKSLIPEGISVDGFLMNFQIHEVKVNKPGLKFPIKVKDKLEAKHIGNELIRQDYRWMDDSKLNVRDFGTDYSLILKYIINNPNGKNISYGSEIHEVKVNNPLGKSVDDVLSLIKNIKLQANQGIRYLEYVNKIDDIIDKYGDVINYRNTKAFLNSLSPQDLNNLYKELEPLYQVNEVKINNPNPSFDDFLKVVNGKNQDDLKVVWEEEGIYDGLNKYGDIKPWINSFSPLKKIELYNKLKNLPTSLNESIESNKNKFIQLLNKCAEECCNELGIKKPEIKIINNPNYTNKNKSYAGYIPSINEVKLVIYGRTLADSCRSLSHELKHAADNSQGLLTPEAGKDGDDHENRANSYAGVKLREFGRQNPEIYFLKYE